MSREREQLLELLRCSMWDNTPSPELFKEGEVEWSKLLNLSQQQAVLGSVYSQFEGLQTKPSRQAMLKLHSLTTLNRKMHLKQLQALNTVTKRLQEAGIAKPVLLKGVGVSMNYPDPGVRQCGDIDLYVGKKHYEKACTLAKSWSESKYHKGSLSQKHFEFSFDGIPIEIHRQIISNSNIPHHASKFTRWCIEQLEGEEVREVEIEGIKTYLPPYNFDAIYIFYHAWNHFCSFGIAFRQICDWCCYLNRYKSEIDQQKLAKDLKYFGIINPWSFFAALSIKHLGAQEEWFTAFDSSKDWHTDIVAERVWRGGNFGYYGNYDSTSKSKLKRKFNNATSLFRSYGFLHSIDRKYSYNFLLRTPLSRVKVNILQMYYNITKRQ